MRAVSTAKTKPMMCCWAQPTQHMKNNLERAALAQTTGAVASVGEQMAAGLWAAAEQFGISRDDGFPARVCTMAFGNGLHLGAREPEKAPLFHEVLRQELPLSPASIADAKQLACELCADGRRGPAVLWSGPAAVS